MADIEALRQDRDANHNRKLAALGHLGELVQAARQTCLSGHSERSEESKKPLS